MSWVALGEAGPGPTFWAVRTVVDWATILGFVFSVGSIWLSVWLAKRDLEKRIREATESSRRAVAQVFESLLRTELTEAVAILNEALAATVDHSWHRAFVRLDDGMMRVSRFLAGGRVAEPQRRELLDMIADLRTASSFVGTIIRPKSRKKSPTDAEHTALRGVLTTLIQAIAAVESQLRLRPLERFDEQPPADQSHRRLGAEAPGPDTSRED
jgi:hypothetical protein